MLGVAVVRVGAQCTRRGPFRSPLSQTHRTAETTLTARAPSRTGKFPWWYTGRGCLAESAIDAGNVCWSETPRQTRLRGRTR
jgi:hypothetical protein